MFIQLLMISWIRSMRNWNKDYKNPKRLVWIYKSFLKLRKKIIKVEWIMNVRND